VTWPNSLIKPFSHTYVRVNDGSPSAYSAEQMAIDEAFVSFHEKGGYEWSKFEVEKLKCDNRTEHYPNLCWHYIVRIHP